VVVYVRGPRPVRASGRAHVGHDQAEVIVTTFGDLLGPADRHRLERFAEPDIQDLAAAARQAAAESTGPGRVAWSLVALALDYSGGSTETARGLIDVLVHDSQVRITTRACLTALCNDSTIPSGP
jgi:hypothetical protein